MLDCGFVMFAGLRSIRTSRIRFGGGHRKRLSGQGAWGEKEPMCLGEEAGPGFGEWDWLGGRGPLSGR